MFYIGLQAGLGNQMFQYAFGIAASLESNIPFKLDLSNYDNQYEKDTPRSFTLQHYNIETPIASASEVAEFHTQKATFLRRVQNKIFPQKNYLYQPQQLKVNNGQYLQGYWQTEKYFKKYEDVIRTQFTLVRPLGAEGQEALAQIRDLHAKGIETVAIQVRRGDYVSNPHAKAFHGSLQPAYFEEAMQKIDELSKASKHIFFVSDDPAWAAEHIKVRHDHSFISRPGTYDFEEIMLMSACTHFIISNSSFGWWGAWLSNNPNKIVVAPKNWVANPKVPTQDAVPESWLRV